MQVYLRQCPRSVIISATHCRPANLTRIFHRNLCRRYCSSSQGEWFRYCFTETTNRPTCNPKLVYKWKIKANESKSIHVTFNTRRETWPTSTYKQCATLPRRCQVSWATPWQETYLAQTYFRKTGTTRKHPHQNVLVTWTKAKTRYTQQTILKSIWTYGIQLWGTASTSNIKILERFQSKALRMIVDAPCMCRIWLSEGISKYEQLKKKSVATALNIVLASAHIQMT
jgi:hypothetical protein